MLYQVYLTEDARNYYAGAVLGLPNCTGGPYVYDCGIEGDRLMQSQLTTISHLDDGTVERVRTAQGELSECVFQVWLKPSLNEWCHGSRANPFICSLIHHAFHHP